MPFIREKFSFGIFFDDYQTCVSTNKVSLNQHHSHLIYGSQYTYLYMFVAISVAVNMFV